MGKRILAFFTAVMMMAAVFSGNMTATTAMAAEQRESAAVEAGTYVGSYTRTIAAMGMSIEYVYSLEMKKDLTYAYTVSYDMMGTTYGNEEVGTYTVEGNTVTFTPSKDQYVHPDAHTGTTKNGQLAAVNRYISDKASAPQEIQLQMAKADQLTSAKYAVDISWQPMMASMMTPIVEMDAAAKTFKVYAAKDTNTDKGHGTITFNNRTGVYTLVFAVAEGEEAKSTTFTYDAAKKAITFTSKLHYGKLAFNNINDAEEFIPYGASVYVPKTDNETKPGDSNIGSDNTTKPGDSNTGSDNTTKPGSSNTGNNVSSTKPGSSANTTKLPAKGTTLKKGTAKYKVTKAGKTVAYVGTTSKKATKITIPATVKINKVTYKVTSIANKALKNNKKVTQVVIGKNVTKIGSQAFYGCKKLKKMTIQSKSLQSKNVGAKAFTKAGSAQYKKLVVKVPSSKVKTYKKMLRSKGLSKQVTVKK